MRTLTLLEQSSVFDLIVVHIYSVDVLTCINSPKHIMVIQNLVIISQIIKKSIDIDVLAYNFTINSIL